MSLRNITPLGGTVHTYITMVIKCRRQTRRLVGWLSLAAALKRKLSWDAVTAETIIWLTT